MQLPVVEECYDWVEKFKSGVIKKSEVTFEIYSILASSGEKTEIIKATAELYVKIFSMTSRSPERLREGEWNLERGRPPTHPDHHVTLPVPLQD